ncbi:UNVERIFIED_CONTAM: hypothetical protein Slati_3136700 [Sesamum latifolium]|uniref:Reverse transcriptase n=1 Tax=Sesamum latifolium TaxID=2727402 RepID=A0AAW2UW81_9LAMI
MGCGARDLGDLTLPSCNLINANMLWRELGQCLGSSRETRVAAYVETCQLSFSSWCKSVFRVDKERVRNLDEKLRRLLAGPISHEGRIDIALIQFELERITTYEETIWRQHSKECGFERATKIPISSIESQCTHPVDLCRKTWPKGTEYLRRVVDASMVKELLQPFMTIEVTKALFQMAPQKSLRPMSAFVLDRLITDNILLVFELNHFLNSKTTGGQGWMALKLDVSKAYDEVEWSFLEQVMSKLDFPPPFVRLVMLYVSSVSYSFMLGATLLGETQSMVANFWWSNRETHIIHICESKLAGGLGFRRLQLFNLVMLAKQLWRILTQPEKLLSRVLKAICFLNRDVFSATLGRHPSFTWRSVMAAQNLFRVGCRWRVGSGDRSSMV